MDHECYCRARRYFKDENYEVWSLEFDYGEGYLAEDKLILKWGDRLKALWLIKSEARMTSEEYESIVLALFEDLVGGEGTFDLKRRLELQAGEYDIQNLIEEHTKYFG